MFPHPSIAVKVLVMERPQPVLTIAPSVEEIVGVPHASVVDAVPSEPVGFAGLHPSETGEYDPVNVGTVLSAIHLTVLEVVAVLLHPSVAVKVLVIERSHPLL